MILNNGQNGIAYYQFPQLNRFERLRHGIFTRHGGVSKAPFNSLNISHGLGDTDRNVAVNRARVARFFKGQAIVYIHQDHGTRIAVVDEHRHTGRTGPPIAADAVVTASRAHALAIQTADCQAVLVYDPIHPAVANIHNGWRGSIGNIIGKTIGLLHAYYGCAPETLQVGLGPSLGPCCAEFVNYKKELPSWMSNYRIGRYHFDFWQLSTDQLKAAGVAPHNIMVSRQCTRCESDNFFSYRGEKITGRFVTVIGMLP